jgi:hypothetical protein
MLVEEGITVTVGVTFAGVVTTTAAEPVPLLYVVELAVSGVYVTVSVSLPVASDPAGILIVAAPPLSVAAGAVYPPPLSVTVPVGVGLPLPPATPRVTVKICVVVMLAADGVTVTVGVTFAGAVTVTGADPVPPAYVAAPAVSGVYVAVSVSVPVASAPAGIVSISAPLLSAVAADVYPPPLSTTVPVGVGLPLPPFTATVTVRLCAVVTVDADGVTVTAGIVFVGEFTVTVPAPDALLYVVELAVSGVYVAVNGSVPAASEPAGIVIVTAPLLSAVAAEM